MNFCASFSDRMVSPCIQCVLIATHWLQSFWSVVLQIFVAPLFTSAGKCYRGFSVHLAKEWYVYTGKARLSCISSGRGHKHATAHADWAKPGFDFWFSNIQIKAIFFSRVKPLSSICNGESCLSSECLCNLLWCNI